MENGTSLYTRAYSRREYRSKTFEDYLIKSLPLKQMMLVPNQTQPVVSSSQGTIYQWKWWLKREGIYKNLNKEEAVYLKREVDRLMANPDNVKSVPTRRSLLIIQVPSELSSLHQPDVFRNFQRLIFNTRVHFDSSFEANLWAPDERGIHARNPQLRKELQILSDMHNQFVEAFKQFKSGNMRRGWVIVRSTFELSGQVVRMQHHRLFPDLLGILLLLQRRGYREAPGLDGLLREHLCLMARVHLPYNDPRRQFFEFIRLVPLESIRHQYLMFDSQCRQLWSSKVTGNSIESYYSYNQASFPRMDRGQFYSLFEGKSIAEILNILSDGDRLFGVYSTEAICLWHTALQYFTSNERHDDMGYVANRLCVRFQRFKDGWDHNLPAQLNHDTAMSFFLHGHAEDAQGNTMSAIDAFYQCVILRSQVLRRETFDPLKGIALRRLEVIASRVGDEMGVGFYQGLLNTMYSDLEAKYIQETASLQNDI